MGEDWRAGPLSFCRIDFLICPDSRKATMGSLL